MSMPASRYKSNMDGRALSCNAGIGPRVKFTNVSSQSVTVTRKSERPSASAARMRPNRPRIFRQRQSTHAERQTNVRNS